MDLQTLKQKATEAFAKGRFARAAELYEEYCAKDARDLQARLRMGDAWAKSGSKDKAIRAYQTAAEAFAREGFLPRAIAASKLIIELDPSHKGVQRMLADLYARRSETSRKPGVAELTGRAPTAPPAPSQPALPPAPAVIVTEPPAPATPAPVSQAQPPAAAPAPPAFPAPPGLKPRRAPGADAGPVVPPPPADEIVELTQKKPVPSAPPARPGWMPGGPSSTPAESAAPEGPARSELKGSLRAFEQVDEMLPRPKSPAPGQPGAQEPLRIAQTFSGFTELSLEGDSLLHAVERAAQAGMTQRAEAPAPAPHEEAAVDTMGTETPPPGTLPKIPLFSDLSTDAFIELFERCALRRFARDELIVEQGSQGNSFFVICAGSVRVLREDSGSRKQLAVLQEGAFFGEMALLSDAPRTASVESASDETQLLEISAPVLAELSLRYPQVAVALKKFCRQRMLVNVMNTSMFFRPFDKKDRKAVIERFRAREVKKGDVIIRENERSDGLYVLLSGEVEVKKGARVLATLKEGELFGEMSLIKSTPATATVSCTRRTSLMRLPREDFEDIMARHPQLLAMICDLMENRRRQTEALLARDAGGADDDLMLV